MTTSIGFCSRCMIIRQDDERGWPITPCACFVEHHADDCRLRIAVRAPIGVPCDDHKADSCPTCFSCTCGVDPMQQFVHGKYVFEWEADVGLLPTRREVEPHAAKQES